MDIVTYCSNGYEFHSGTDGEKKAKEQAQVEVRVHLLIMALPEFEKNFIYVQMAEKLGVQ